VAQAIPIQYREFYDIPRMFIAEYGGETYLFDGSFDDALDDYPPSYSVFVLPHIDLSTLSGSWADLSRSAVRMCGEVSTDAVVFDPTRRQSISPDVFGRLGAARALRGRSA
jgi:hypothetical protein